MVDESKYPTRIAPFGVRIPPDLKGRVQAAAEMNNRSMNMEIVATLGEKYPEPAESGDYMSHLVAEALISAEDQDREYMIAKIHNSLKQSVNLEKLQSRLLAILRSNDLAAERAMSESLAAILREYGMKNYF